MPRTPAPAEISLFLVAQDTVFVPVNAAKPSAALETNVFGMQLELEVLGSFASCMALFEKQSARIVTTRKIEERFINNSLWVKINMGREFN